jgi:hypothetical protein
VDGGSTPAFGELRGESVVKAPKKFFLPSQFLTHVSSFFTVQSHAGGIDLKSVSQSIVDGQGHLDGVHNGESAVIGNQSVGYTQMPPLGQLVKGDAAASSGRLK